MTLRSHPVLASFWVLAGRLHPRFRPHSSLKLVVLPAPSEAPRDPLTQAARDLVQAYDDYVANVDHRFERGRGRGGLLGFKLQYGVPLARARAEYHEAALASADPFHQHLAALVGSAWSPYWMWTVTDGPAHRILHNWVREEPDVETQPAAGRVSQTSAVVQFGRSRAANGYTTTLSLEAVQSLPEPAAYLCIDVGTEVSMATLTLIQRRGESVTGTDLVWKKTRVWVLVEGARLEAGDRIDITLTSAKPIPRSVSVRIGTSESGRH